MAESTTSTSEVAAGSTSTAPDPVTDGISLTVADGWTVTTVGRGAKPVLALDSSGAPGIALIIEALDGFIGYASADEGWEIETVPEGYFYEPIGPTYGLDDTPYIAYHDHQAPDFDMALGDLTVAEPSAGTWSSFAIPNDGHDGWDTTIVAGTDGVLRAAGIDPEQFGRDIGVEYFELVDDT